MPGAELRRGDRYLLVDRVDGNLEPSDEPSCLAVLARPCRMHKRFGQRVRGNAQVVVGVRVDRRARGLMVRVARVEQRNQHARVEGS